MYVVYSTCSDIESAKLIARSVVQESLAACVNIVGPNHSVYKDGDLVESEEYSLLIKAPQENVDKLIEYIKKIHPYETPCIIGWKIDCANNEFLEWVKSFVG